MAKALIITEKPSVARDIADALGGFREHDGYYESDDLRRHLRGRAPLRAARRPRRSTTSTSAGRSTCCRSCPSEFRYKAKKGQTERIRTIKRLIEREDVDAVDQRLRRRARGRADLPRDRRAPRRRSKPIRRLWLQSMTDEAIRDGFARLRPRRRAPGPRRRRRLSRALGLADRHERDARAHQAAQEPQGEDGVVGGARADADARDAGRQGARGAGARAAARSGASPRRFEHAGQPLRGAAGSTRRFAPGDDPERKDDRIFDEARARRDRRRGDRVAPAARERDAQAVARVGAAALRPDQPAARGATAASAGRRAARSRRRSAATSATSSSPIRAPTRAACRATTARRWPRRSTSFAGGGRRGEDGFADYARRGRRGCASAGSRTRRASSTTRASPITSRSSRPARCPREPLTGDDKRLFDLVARRFLGAFHPPALWERVERTTVVGERAASARARARSSSPGWRSRAAGRRGDEEEAPLPPLRARAPSEASGVAVRDARGAERRRRRPSRRRASPRRACSR